MSQFKFEDYQKVVEKAQSGGSNAVKVGFFKLKDNGDEALARINCSSVEDLDFASVHTVQSEGKWMKVSCLNPVGAYADNCPLCNAAAENPDGPVSKANKKVYIQMIVSYKDRATGQFSAPIPVIWERPAAFSRDIANALRDYGDLHKVLLKITRNGKAGDMKTAYSLNYAIPTVFKPELIPEDFGAFDNFNIAKHSYWEKTKDEIDTFIATGAFPAYQSGSQQAAKPAAQIKTPAPVKPTTVVAQPAPAATPATAVVNPATPVTPTPTPATVTPAAAPAATPTAATTPAAPTRPARNFNGFSF